MSDWGEAAIIESFPSVGDTYFIQFIIEPELKDCVSKDGRKYQQVVLRLQFLAPNEQTGAYEYLGWGEIRVQPCVLKGFLLYRSLILTSMFEVKGIPHKRHVDLEIIETHPIVLVSEALDAQSGPLKITATQLSSAGERSQVDSSGQGQAGAGGVPETAESEPRGAGPITEAQQLDTPPPANCTHENVRLHIEPGPPGTDPERWFECQDCGEWVG